MKPENVLRYAHFMHDIGSLKNKPAGLSVSSSKTGRSRAAIAGPVLTDVAARRGRTVGAGP